MAVKKTIEESQGEDSYPWDEQLLVYNGKLLKDESTLEENEVSENDILLVMCSKVPHLFPFLDFFYFLIFKLF